MIYGRKSQSRSEDFLIEKATNATKLKRRETRNRTGTSAQGATFTALGGNSWQIYSRLDAHKGDAIKAYDEAV